MNIQETFVSLDEACPSILIEASYATINNFTGNVVDGYKSKKVFLTKEAAKALCLVQEEALHRGFSLKLFDGYRPEKAVRFFQAWAADESEDLNLKLKYYPGFTKRELFENGYIATRSSHSRGSAIDLTLVEKSTLKELDMGSDFDYFDVVSHTESQLINPTQQENRRFLRELMEKQGFKNYHKEWWHFSLKVEPFPATYFDFDIY